MVPTRWPAPPRSRPGALGLNLAQVAGVRGATPTAWSQPWPRTRRHSKVWSASSPAPWRRSAACGPDADPALKSRADQTQTWLVEDRAAVSEALVALAAGLESEGPAILVVDIVEQGLD